MFQYKVKCLFLKDINPKKDVHLGDTSVQINGLDGYPSIHIAKSYMLAGGNHVEHDTGSFYYILHYKSGNTAVNYREEHFEQVGEIIQLNEHWNVFYQDLDDDVLIPIPKENFLPVK